MAEPGFLGDPRKSHPLPIRLRNTLIPKEDGGAEGYRGAGFAKARKRALYLARYRSTATGDPQEKVTLFVDHIQGYRISDVNNPLTNSQLNLRVLDASQNKYLDTMTTASEKPAIRRMRAF